MNKHKLILGDYLHVFLKILMIYPILTVILFGVNNLQESGSMITNIIGLLTLLAAATIIGFTFSKKMISVTNQSLNKGFSIANMFFIINKIQLDDYSEFIYERMEKSRTPLFLRFSFFGLFDNYYECSIFLVDKVGKQRKLLISLSEFEMYFQVRDFLLINTVLKEGTTLANNG